MVPNGWAKIRIDELGAVRGGRQRSPHFTKGEKHPYLRVANVFDGFIDTSDVNEMLFTHDEFIEYKLEPGDILLNEGQSIGLVGRCALYDGKPANCCFQNTLIRFRPLPDTDTQFVRYLFQHCQYSGKFAEIAVQTTSIAHLGTSRLAALRILIPPLPEQRAIAAILATWDRAIEQTTRLIAVKQRLKQGLMQQLLTGKRRLADGSPWQQVKIGSVAQETFRPVAWKDDELYRLASVRRWSGGVFARENLYGHQIKVKKLHTICEGDFLISNIQSAYGAMALVPTEFDGAKVSELYTILTPRTSTSLDMRFIAYLSEQPRLRHMAYLASNGFFAERLRLNFDPTEFLEQIISLPVDISEQREIANILDTATREMLILEQQLEAIRQQKQALMQKLLTGQVRVKVVA